jgi:hypothetical protein
MFKLNRKLLDNSNLFINSIFTDIVKYK